VGRGCLLPAAECGDPAPVESSATRRAWNCEAFVHETQECRNPMWAGVVCAPATPWTERAAIGAKAEEECAPPQSGEGVRPNRAHW